MEPEPNLNLKEFANRIIGIPFSNDWRCWEPIKLAYKDCYDLEVPGGLGLSSQDPEAAAEAILAEAKAWQEISIGQEKIGDVIIFRPCHAGIVIGPGRMLNCREKAGTVIERYDSAVWRNAIIGIYRHAELAAG